MFCTLRNQLRYSAKKYDRTCQQLADRRSWVLDFWDISPSRRGLGVPSQSIVFRRRRVLVTRISGLPARHAAVSLEVAHITRANFVRYESKAVEGRCSR